jgi:hypothetical protein
MLRVLLGSTAGVLGIGLGFGALSEVGRWATEAPKFAAQAATGALGGPPGTYEMLAQAGGGGGTFATPTGRQSIKAALLRMGYGGGNLENVAAISAQAGLIGWGSEAAGERLASQFYGVTRSDDLGRVLGTVVSTAQQQGRHGGEMVQQLAAIVGLLRSQGQFARGDVTGVANLIRDLNALPGQVGRGEGGVQITQGLTGIGQDDDPIGQGIAMRAYMKATGKRFPHTAQEWLDYAIWNQDPTQALHKGREVAPSFGDPAWGGLWLTKHLPPAVAARVVGAAGAPQEPSALLSEHAATQSFAGDVAALQGTPGGRELANRRQLEETRSMWGRAATLKQQYEHLLGTYPVPTAIGTGAAGLGLGLGLGRSAVGGWAFRRQLARLLGRGGAAAAGGSLLPRWLLGAGAVGGGLGLTKDLIDLGTGTDPTNPLDLLFGGTGALAGLALGIPGGPLGMAGGALAGYGIGKDVAGGMELLGGLTERQAAPGRVNLHASLFRGLEQAYGLPRGVLSAIASVESGGDPRARSPHSSAAGLFQFIRGTAHHLGLSDADRLDPVKSADAAARYLRENFAKLGTWDAAIGAHYGGPGNPSALYARKVGRRMGEFADDPDVPLGEAGMGGLAEVLVSIAVDPSFPGAVTATSSHPRVAVRRVQ